MLAAVGDLPYNIVYLIHIFSVILGVGMAFIAPMFAVRARRSAGQALQEIVTEAASNVMFTMSTHQAGCACSTSGKTAKACSVAFYISRWP